MCASKETQRHSFVGLFFIVSRQILAACRSPVLTVGLQGHPPELFGPGPGPIPVITFPMTDPAGAGILMITWLRYIDGIHGAPYIAAPLGSVMGIITCRSYMKDSRRWCEKFPLAITQQSTSGHKPGQSTWVMSQTPASTVDYWSGGNNIYPSILSSGGITFIISGWWFGTWILFFHSVGMMSSSQLTNSMIFQKGRSTTKQLLSLVVFRSWPMLCRCFCLNGWFQCPGRRVVSPHGEFHHRVTACYGKIQHFLGSVNQRSKWIPSGKLR